MKSTLVASIAAALALVACGGSNGGTNPGIGPLAIGIVSGDHQVVTAGHDSLPQPVVGKLVRKPDGSVAWIKQIPGRALDVLVPRAFAQGTVVTGSPVAGAVVCAVSTDPNHKLTPFVPCTNTDANGQATFFFTASTKAGVASAEIRGTVNSEPAVFDTASATVTADTIQVVSGDGPDMITVAAGDSIDLNAIAGVGFDKYQNNISPADANWPTARYVLLSPDSAMLVATGSVTPAQKLMSDNSVSVAQATAGRYAKITAGTGRIYVWFGNGTVRRFITLKP